MQTVPSLVGTGTAVAAAAAGLVFGQALESTTNNPRPSSNKRKITSEPEAAQHTAAQLHIPSALQSTPPGSSSASQLPHADNRPAHTHAHPTSPVSAATTTASARLPRPLSTQFTPPKTSSRRQSFIRQGDYPPPPIAEDSRDSVSSNGSWMRRLSIRPLSQHGSPRSSVGPDSPSITFSHGSSVPILSPCGPALPPLPPNKLVKRSPSTHDHENTGPITRRRSRSHLPTLRRPATSHQRSATLQQFHQSTSLAQPSASPKLSLDQQPRPQGPLPVALSDLANNPSHDIVGWISFFHSRTIRVGGKGASGRAPDSSPSSRLPLTLKRICVNGDSDRAVYLIRPATLGSGTSPPHSSPLENQPVLADSQAPIDTKDTTATVDDTPSKRARRSISMTFASPGNWISRAGSIRRPKRASETKGGTKRHVSAPVTSPTTAQEDAAMSGDDPDDQIMSRSGEISSSNIPQPHARKRNSSSPLPPLSRLSSFNVDLSKLSTASASVPLQQARQHQPSGSSHGSVPMLQRLALKEWSPTRNSSDFDPRDFGSGDDYDTDFKSDAIFDSFRTVASARARTVETPLESMFDESPPSTAGNTKTKRLSIQEILGPSWDGNHQIMEEDEGICTPIRDAYQSVDRMDYNRRDVSPASPFRGTAGPNSYPAQGKDSSRLSIDDEFDDDDWARDTDDNPLSNHLSPPSKGSSVNSSGVSPNARMALAAISGNGGHEVNERPLSNLFDWSEPPAHDRCDADRHTPRPKTVHGKQDMDMRGGRSATRKGPTAAHVRSQSVPIVQEQSDTTRIAPAKFGTWGLGSKTVSEDWGDDFEFEETASPAVSGKDPKTKFVMMVPPSIQATQPSVKAHSGQIRELSLLVNDLKRLCRHGRDMDMLDGPQYSLWKEAEGIIALASPDEDAMGDIEGASPTVEIPPGISGRFLDDGFDSKSLAGPEDPFRVPDVSVSQTGVVKERHSPRRRSVFSPEDDIFGGSWPIPDDVPLPDRPRTPENNLNQAGRNVTNVSGVVRTVMEAMQNRSVSDSARGADGKLHFDTASLKALVKRAGDLRDVLADIIRTADPIAQSPARTSRHDSPAFTRVFTDPSTSPPRRPPQSHGSKPGLNRASIDTSPTSAVSQRMQMMIVR